MRHPRPLDQFRKRQRNKLTVGRIAMPYGLTRAVRAVRPRAVLRFAAMSAVLAVISVLFVQQQTAFAALPTVQDQAQSPARQQRLSPQHYQQPWLELVTTRCSL